MRLDRAPPTQEPGERQRRWPDAVGVWWRMLRVAYLRFGFGAGYIFAAAIALYSVVCLAPLGILLAAGLQAIAGSGSTAHRWLQQAAHQLGGQAAEQIMTQVDGLLANPGVNIAGPVSVVVLMWSGLRLFDTVERSLTDVWPGRILRGYFRRKLMSLAMMFVAGLLLASFVLMEVFSALARSWLQQFPQIDPAAVDMLRPPLLLVAQFVFSVIAFTLVYKFVPVQRVPGRVAVRGGVCAAILWHAASPVFIHLITVTRSEHYSAIYGGLAGVVVFSLWALLSAWVLLLGAHFAAAYDHVFVRRRPQSEDDSIIGWPGKVSTDPEPPTKGE